MVVVSLSLLCGPGCFVSQSAFIMIFQGQYHETMNLRCVKEDSWRGPWKSHGHQMMTTWMQQWLGNQVSPSVLSNASGGLSLDRQQYYA